MNDDLKRAGLTPGQAEAVQKLLDDRLAALQHQVDSLSAALSELEKPKRLAEIAAMLTARARRRAEHPRARRAFVIDLLCSAEPDMKGLTRESLYLDDGALDREYDHTLVRIGAVRKPEIFLNKLTFRLLDRLVRRYAPQLEISERTLREAWHHAVMMEVWHVVAARHIARRIAASAAGGLVVFPLSSLTAAYLSHGIDARGVDRFYLAAELQRRGVPVVFLWKAGEGGLPTHLRFAPHRDLWAPSPIPLPPQAPARPGGRAVLVGAGIRGIAQITSRHPDLLRIRSNYVFDSAFGQADEEVFDRRHLPVTLSFPLAEDAAAGLPDGVTLLTTALFETDLGHYLFVALGGATASAAAMARDMVARHNLTEAHVCDHPFFESALVANAVQEAGGRVVLWPHSFNPAVPEFRPAGTVDAVYCVIEASAALWRRHHPDATVTVLPNFWLPPYAGPRPADPEKPLTVVVIANEYGAASIDYMDKWSLEVTYRRLFPRLEALGPEVDFTVRPRSQRGLNWLWRLAGLPPRFPHTQSPPMLVDQPNMVFLIVGLMSSALFEGICRGIPVLYLRQDPDVQEYVMPEMPDCLPVGDVAFIEGEIGKCRDPAYRRALIERQAAWYEAETGGV